MVKLFEKVSERTLSDSNVREHSRAIRSVIVLPDKQSTIERSFTSLLGNLIEQILEILRPLADQFMRLRVI